MKHVAAAIAIRQGRVLLARRATGQHLAGYWEFPGGKVEPNETLQACIVRELWEELGIRARAGQVVADSMYAYAGGAIHLHGIAVEIDAHEEPRLRVHDAILWVALEQLLERKLAPADVPIAAELKSRFGRSET